MRRILNDLKIMLLANLWLVPVLAALVGAVFYLVAPPPPMSARMVTGPQGGAYAQFAERLQAELAKEGFTLELQPSIVAPATAWHNCSPTNPRCNWASCRAAWSAPCPPPSVNA